MKLTKGLVKMNNNNNRISTRFKLMYVFMLLFLSTPASSREIDTSSILTRSKMLAISLFDNSNIEKSNVSNLLIQCNAEVLQSRGFKDIIFIKVEIRSRHELLDHLFRRSIGDSIRRYMDREIDIESYENIKDSILKNICKISDSTPNKLIEILSQYHLTESGSDIYLAYAKNFELFVLNANEIKYFSKRFLFTLYDGAYFDDKINAELTLEDKKALAKGKLPDFLVKNLFIDNKSLREISSINPWPWFRYRKTSESK